MCLTTPVPGGGRWLRPRSTTPSYTPRAHASDFPLAGQTESLKKNLRLHRGKMSVTQNTHPNLKIEFFFYRHQGAKNTVRLEHISFGLCKIIKYYQEMIERGKKSGERKHMTMENVTVAHGSWKARNNLKRAQETAQVPPWPSVCDDGGTHHLWMLKPTVHWACKVHPSHDPLWVTNSTTSGTTKKYKQTSKNQLKTTQKKPPKTKTHGKAGARTAAVVMLKGISVITPQQLRCWTNCRWNLASQMLFLLFKNM